MKLKADIEKQIEEVIRYKQHAKSEDTRIYYQGVQEALQWMLRSREDGCKDISWGDK